MYTSPKNCWQNRGETYEGNHLQTQLRNTPASWWELRDIPELVHGECFLKTESPGRHALWNQVVNALKNPSSAIWQDFAVSRAGSYRPELDSKHHLLLSNQEWRAVSLIYIALAWWFILSSTRLHLKSSRRHTSGKVYEGVSREFSWERKTHPGSGQPHPMGCGHRLNKKWCGGGGQVECEHSSVSVSWLKIQCDQPPSPLPSSLLSIPLIVKQNSPFFK